MGNEQVKSVKEEKKLCLCMIVKTSLGLWKDV